MTGNCIDLSENVTIHLQFSDFENEDHVSFVENIFPFLSFGKKACILQNDLNF